MHNRLWICAAIVAMLAAGAAFLLPATAVPPPVSSDAAPTAKRGAPRASAMAQPAAPSASLPGESPQVDVSAALRGDYAGATDLRAFALAAMQRPREGGYFYAWHAIARCIGANGARFRAGVQRSIAEHGTVDNAQIAAGERSLSLCASFDPSEAAALLKEVAARAADGADPLYAADRALRAAWASDSRDVPRALVAQLLALGDPLQLSSSGALLLFAAGNREAQDQGGWWMDGRVVPSTGPEAVVTTLALSLGVCRDAEPCAANELLATECADRGACFPDWQSWVRSGLDSEGVPPAAVEHAFALVARVRRAVQERDVDFFVR